MKVLILHQHFKTPDAGGAIRSWYLARALVERGIEVAVITGHKDKSYRNAIVDGIEVHYVPVSYENSFGFYQRSFSFLHYVRRAIAVSRTIKGIRICYAISVPLTIGIAAIWIKRCSQIPFIFEVGDLWPEAPIQMGFVQNTVFQKMLYALEKKIYQQAESIVALSPMIRESIQKKAPGKTVHLIPNMADVDFYSPSPKRDDLEQKFGVKNKFVISYIGAIGLANGLDYFLECARAAQRAALPVHFLLCGEGAMLPNLKKAAALIELQNLSFIPFQTRDGVRDLMNITDAAFVSYRNVPVLETGSPNKYFDALAAGKLILINFGGWIHEEISKNQCGVYLEPDRPSGFVEALQPFISSKDHLLVYQQRARALAISKYSREKLTTAFADLFIRR